jgi:hypothetical protein
LIGVHGASDAAGEETIQSNAATISMARIVKELGVPANVIGKMVVTPPDQILWLTIDDLRAMDVKFFGKPVQIQPDRQLESHLPQQLSPNTEAKTAPVPTWDEFVKKVIATSSSQNNGHPKFIRLCQPELKTCVSGISYRTKDGDAFVKTTEDLNGKIISREACQLNQFGDVRTCLNWDTGAMHKDMKNLKGDWYAVSE